MSAVDRPDHYQFPRLASEMAEITINMRHARACAIEYIYRAGKKHGDEIEDLKKARWWIDREILECEENRINDAQN